MRRRTYFPWLILLAACAPSASVPPSRVSAPLASPPSSPSLAVEALPGLSASATYPIRFPVLGEEDLALQTKHAEERSPGWSILLSPIGTLHRASCNSCERSIGKTLTEDDKINARKFLEAQAAITHLEADDVRIAEEFPGSVVYSRRSFDRANAIRLARHDGVLTIAGWIAPTIDLPTGDPDRLKEKLKALYWSEDLTYDLHQRLTARSLSGPVELRKVACWMSLRDDGDPKSASFPELPCVDAETGEDLTGLAVTWTVETRDGREHCRLSRIAKSKP